MQKRNLVEGRHRFQSELLQWSAGVGIALLVPFLLSLSGVVVQIDTQLGLFGFDTERVTLLTSLLLAFLSSLCTALFLQRCGPAWIGGLILFVLHYLFPFVQLALHPGLGPAGQTQVLIPGAFINVVLTLLALSVLSAGAGAVIGKACGALLLVPLVMLGRLVLVKGMQSVLPANTIPVSLFRLSIGGMVISAFLLTALGVFPLLTYGSTTNLYQPVPVQGKHLLAGGLPVPPAGTLASATFSSPALGGIKRRYWIYLPPSYAIASSRHYPTFYLLHGSPGRPDDWFQAAHAASTADALIAQGRMRETILVGVDGNGPIYRFSEWANSCDGRQRMEDALVRDLLPLIDRRYRTLADAADRAIGGLSMGGYGAANIALHHPELFHKVMSVGGYFQAEGPVFGSGREHTACRQFNSPSLLLQTPSGKQSASRMTFVIGVGTTDGRYYHEGTTFYQQLRSLEIRVRLLIATGGHSWTLWAEQLGEALPLLEPDSPLTIQPG
jgi:enterochelin esterase-like enzyme